MNPAAPVVPSPQGVPRKWSRWRFAVAAAVVALVAAATCLFSVEESQHALVIEFGKPVQVITHAGLGAKLPYQSVRKLDSRLFVSAPSSSEFLTMEKTPVVAGATMLWRVAEPKKFFETVYDRAGAESRLNDLLFAELGAAIGANPLSAFVAAEPGAYRAEAIVAQVTQRSAELARKAYGIELREIILQNFDFPTQNRARVYARMTSERGRMSMRYRSEGEEEGLKVRAAAEKEKSGILTEALKVAQQHRAQGEGEAARIYGETLSKGPEFYRFLRTMEASRNLVPKETTLVLPADSELFGLLYDSSHYESDHGAKRAARKEMPMR